MFSCIWPVALVIFSNVVYQICTRSVPEGLDPFASLTATYLVGAAVSAALYYLIGSGGNLVRECGKLNWTSLVPGFVIVGLEVGKHEMMIPLWRYG